MTVGERPNGGDGRGACPRLFARDELLLRPTGAARLRRLARRPLLHRTDREKRIVEDREILQRLREWGAELTDLFGLRCRALDAEREGITEYYGICYEDGVIRIRLRHARTGRLLKESSLVDTLCHELAHLRYMDHGSRFRRLYLRILGVARERRYYRPGPAGPRQPTLFDACGTAGRAVAGESHETPF